MTCQPFDRLGRRDDIELQQVLEAEIQQAALCRLIVSKYRSRRGQQTHDDHRTKFLEAHNSIALLGQPVESTLSAHPVVPDPRPSRDIVTANPEDFVFMHQVVIPLERRGFGKTMRRDAWWAQSLLTLVVLGGFVVYATWAAFQGNHYEYGPYLSPFYSPLLYGEGAHSWFGPQPAWWPGALPFSAALLILWAPGGFRFTCYYYRGAYYKAFWADPPSCAVGEPRKRYLGENSFPLLFQNIHRYFLYLALLFLIVLAYDVWKALWFTDANGDTSFGIGVGTIVLAVNLVLLGGYTLGCHSFRHLVGGVLDQCSKHPTRLVLYDCATSLNCRHMKFAWASLFSVALADLYIRLCSMGVLTDWRII